MKYKPEELNFVKDDDYWLSKKWLKDPEEYERVWELQRQKRLAKATLNDEPFEGMIIYFDIETDEIIVSTLSFQ